MPDPLPLHLNLDEIPWESTTTAGRYGCDEKFVAEHVAQRRLDLAMVRLAPGKRSWPFHFHHIGEELFFVLEGTGELRLGSETRRLRPHDVVSCLPGPEGAHQIFNDGDQPLVYMAISTVDDVELAEYPDSDKVMSYVVRDGRPAFQHISRRADAVGYMDGEPN